MPSSWANFGIDLHLELAGQRSADGRSADGRRVRVGLETALRQAVRSGRLGSGTKLPPSRGLAADLGIARNTVAEAYAQLIAEGWLTARTGSGTWVADRPAVARTSQVVGGTGQVVGRSGPAVAPPAPGLASASAAAPDQVRVARFDLTAGVPTVAMFPRAQWLSAARAALQAAPDYVLGYPDPQGLPELRIALAGYLARTRGVITNPDRIVICAGYAHGLALIASALAYRGATTIAVEDYGRLEHRQLISAHGLRAEPLPIDDLGTIAVPSVLDGASAVALTPAHQFPLGMTLAPRRRAAFTGWAAQAGGVLIEDDYDGEFRYDRQIRLARLAYRRRRDQLIAALSRNVPAVHLTGIAAGLHAVAMLPPASDETGAIARAAAHGVAVDGLASYATAAHTAGPALVIGYSRPAAHAYTTAITRLCAALAEA
jgi:GntR family transcriptional regulator / MocR family aminotransferase